MIDETEQRRMMHELRFNLDDELEFTIRAMAKHASENPQSYRDGGLRLPWTDGLRFPVDSDSNDPIRWSEIWVKLHSGLELHSHAAALVAERIIRQQINEIRGVSRMTHTLEHPVLTERADRMPFGETTYEIRARIDDTIINARHVVPRTLAVRAESEDGLKKAVKYRIEQSFIAELAKYLGFESYA